MRYTRQELQAITAARRSLPEGQGVGAFIEFRVKVTPELLEQMLGGTWVAADGKRARLESVEVDSDGYLVPELVAEVSA